MKLLIIFLATYCVTNIVAEADAEAKPEAKAQGIYLGGTGLYSNYGTPSVSHADSVYSKRYGYGHNLGILGIGHVIGYGNGNGNAFGYGNRPGFNHGYGIGSVAFVPYSVGAHGFGGHGFGGHGLVGNGIGPYGIFGNRLGGHRFLGPSAFSPVLGGHSLFSQGFPGYEFNGQNLIGHRLVGNNIGGNDFAGQGLVGSPFLSNLGFQNTGHLTQPIQLHNQAIYSVPEYQKGVSFIDAKPTLGFEHGLGFDSHGKGVGHQISHITNHALQHKLNHGNNHGHDHIVQHGSGDEFRHSIGNNIGGNDFAGQGLVGSPFLSNLGFQNTGHLTEHGSEHGAKTIHSVQSIRKSPSVIHGGIDHGQGHEIQGLHSVQNVQNSVPASQILKSVAVTQGNFEQVNGRIVPSFPNIQNVQNVQSLQSIQTAQSQSVQKPIQAVNKQKTIQFRIINPSTPFNFEKSDNKGFTPKFTEFKSFDSVEQY